MKWDVKHDRAKKVIDRFLDNAGYWQESEDLVAGLTDEEKELVNAEVELMIASIRKRYKLQERLPEQAVEAEKPAEKAVEEAVEKAVEEPVKKPRARKPKTENATEEKPAAKRTRTKKAEKEKAKDHGEND